MKTQNIGHFFWPIKDNVFQQDSKNNTDLGICAAVESRASGDTFYENLFFPKPLRYSNAISMMYRLVDCSGFHSGGLEMQKQQKHLL